jgi:hypothetical protein
VGKAALLSAISAGLAQLGERQTEDLKALRSIRKTRIFAYLLDLTSFFFFYKAFDFPFLQFIQRTFKPRWRWPQNDGKDPNPFS